MPACSAPPLGPDRSWSAIDLEPPIAPPNGVSQVPVPASVVEHRTPFNDSVGLRLSERPAFEREGAGQLMAASAPLAGQPEEVAYATRGSAMVRHCLYVLARGNGGQLTDPVLAICVRDTNR
jgi:hypothetical protein